MSLALSITVVPVMARWAFRHHRREPAPDTAAAGSALTRTYERALTAMVRRPFGAVVFAGVLGIGGPPLYFAVGTGFLPKADEGGFVIDYLTPAGSSLEETDRLVRKMENVLQHHPDLVSVHAPPR